MELGAKSSTSSSNASSQTIRIMRNYLDYENSYQFESNLNDQFEQLKQLTNDIRLYKLKSTYEGDKESNRKRNRYRDIVPYDDTRVILNKLDDTLDSTNNNNNNNNNDYINASYVKGALDTHYKYIAAQGPSKDTIIDFVRMLVQFNIKIVICACNEYEGQRLKCFRYWTDKFGENLNLHKNYYISLKSKPIVHDGCIERELVVRNLQSSSNNSNDLFNNEYEFTQIHITNWPDHGVPNDIESIMKTLEIVRRNYGLNSTDSNRNNKISSEYLAVHCSAGCGRTGTIIAIDQLWTLLEHNKLTDDFSLFKIAYSLREQRIAMIQTLSQYQLFAKAVGNLFEKELAKLNVSFKNKLFPVRSNQSNYDNITYFKNNNQSSTIRSISPLTVQKDDLFLKPTYTSPPSRSFVDSNNNTIDHSILDYSDNSNKKRESSLITPKQSNFIINNFLSSNNNQTKSTVQQQQQQQHHKSNQSEMTQSLIVKPKSSRFTPNSLFNIFSPHYHHSSKSTDKQNKQQPQPPTQSSSSSASSYPVSSTPSTASSISPSQSDKLNRNEKFNDDILSNSVYLTVNQTSQKSNLNRSVMVTPASKTYLTSKSISIDSNNNNSSSNYINLKQITSNDSTSSSISSTNNGSISSSATTTTTTNNNQPKQQTILQFNKSSTSPQFPRKLFYSNESNTSSSTTTTTNDKSINDTISITESIYNNESVSSNERQRNHGELYLNDISLNKKEAGSVCEFLSNKLEINKQITSNNNTSSLSVMSDLNSSPFLVKSSKNFVLSTNQAKLSSVKQTDLRQVNPPLKAELLDSLPNKTNIDTTNKRQELNNNTNTSSNEDQPKAPIRRSKKLYKNEENINNKSEPILENSLSKSFEAKKLGNYSIKYEKNNDVNLSKTLKSQLGLQDSGVVFRSSRSNSSTYYDNQNESIINNNNTTTTNEHTSTNTRNALLMEQNVEQDQLNNGKSKQPQLRVKTQKNVDSNISQTLPSRKSMSSINNETTSSEQVKRKDAQNQFSNNNHMSHQRNSHISQHFNYPYRIQFAKNPEQYTNPRQFNKQQQQQQQQQQQHETSEDGKHFLYNNKLKNDLNLIRNSENLSEINQIKRRSAHLFNL